ncbi:HlyD family secretion protein [Thioclava atlantica]|uniref:Curdlan synthesis protein n=1 Tax=Thioclava atlantica TaxID=1317124 RepID=A0A085TZV4_9RHOB|nr:HlyD family efflux transporter periplasmic adaptor subunit [Thioclava atlantica]KFE36251.1 Curdlan synthesis protein [Thioclava atlantica]
MRVLKFAVGAALLLLALWVVVGEQLTGVSADATINAPVVTLRTPIAGTLDIPERQLGSAVAPDDIVATVNDENGDHVHLDDLQMQRDIATATLQQMQSELTDLKARQEALAKRSKTYGENRVNLLETRLKYARERLDLLGGKAGNGEDAAPPSLALNRAREEVDALAAELASAQSGVFVGDGYADAPASQQRALQLEGEIAATQSRIDEQKARLTALKWRIRVGTSAVKLSENAQIQSNVAGIYWQELAHDGTYVNRGDPVSRVIDCGNVLVTASVPEMTYQRLRRGQRVAFRPIGQRTTFEGYIVRLAGAGAATVYEGMAVAPSQRHLQRYDVAVAVPGLASDSDLQCAIGRTGRVFFDARPLDVLRGLF